MVMVYEDMDLPAGGAPQAEVRITLVGAAFLAIVALLPEIVFVWLKVYDWTIASFFGGTSLLIVVSVVVETMKQIEAQLMMRNYEGFIR